MRAVPPATTLAKSGIAMSAPILTDPPPICAMYKTPASPERNPLSMKTLIRCRATFMAESPAPSRFPPTAYVRLPNAVERARKVLRIQTPIPQYNMEGKPATKVVARLLNVSLCINWRWPFERYQAIPSRTIEIPSVAKKDGTLNFARSSPLMNPNPMHTTNARGITSNPIFSIYNTHISAESFSIFGTEKSKDPVIMTKVNPHAAIRKYDIA